MWTNSSRSAKRLEDRTGEVRAALQWSVPDRARAGTDTAFEGAYTELADRIEGERRLGPGEGWLPTPS